MPSAEDATYLFKVMPETTQDFLTHDVDLLVSQIKENLRLTNLKSKKTNARRNDRPSPYIRISMRHLRCGKCSNNNKDNKDAEDDPYEKLCELLKQGRLINEAVKKLQTMKHKDISSSNSEIEDEDMDEDIDEHGDNNNDDSVHYRRRAYRRKTYYYDSEDEPLPEVYQPLDL